MLARVQEIAETLLHALPAPHSDESCRPGDLRTQIRAIGAQTRTAWRERDFTRNRRSVRGRGEACGYLP
jgi:hypothetical protein